MACPTGMPVMGSDSRAVVYRNEQFAPEQKREPVQKDLEQSPSAASLTHSDPEKKTLGQSVSVASLMSNMSDTSGGPVAVGPPRTSQTALGHGEMLQPYLPAVPLASLPVASLPVVPLGSDQKSPNLQEQFAAAQPRNGQPPMQGRECSQTEQPMSLDRKASTARAVAVEASVLSPAQQTSQSSLASSDYRERGSNREGNIRVVEAQPMVTVTQRETGGNVPMERETYSTMGATWVIEEVIDFGVPVDECIHEIDEPGLLHGCRSKALGSDRNGIFDGCVRTVCAEEVHKNPDDDFC